MKFKIKKLPYLKKRLRGRRQRQIRKYLKKHYGINLPRSMRKHGGATLWFQVKTESETLRFLLHGPLVTYPKIIRSWEV